MRRIMFGICALALGAAAADAQQWLKQSTAVDITIGPFVDSLDGVTPKTTLSITQPDIRLKKNGDSWAQKNAAQTLTHEENGYYELALDATDTNMLGRLRVAVNESGALPVRQDFMVVPANVHDALVGRHATDKLEIDVAQVARQTATVASTPLDANVTKYGGASGIFSGGRPEVTTSGASNAAIQAADPRLLKAASVVGVTSQTDIDVSPSSGAANTWVGQQIVLFDTSAPKPSVRYILTDDGAGRITMNAAPDFSVVAGDTAKIYATDKQLTDIKTKTDSVLPDAGPGAAGGLPTVDANNAVKVQSGTGANQISLTNRIASADVTQISSDVTAADNLESEYDGTGYAQVLKGTTVASLGSMTVFALSSGALQDDVYNNMLVIVRDASNSNLPNVPVITNYDGATNQAVTVSPALTFTPTTGDPVVIFTVTP